jgi:hypothetical protein
MVHRRSRPDSARREEERGEGELRDRLGTRVASGNGPREGARGSDAEAAVRHARARPAHRPLRRRVLAANCFTVPLFDHDFLPILK